VRYFNERLVTSPRQRMAVTGRDVLLWLSQPFIMQTQRAQFEALLLDIAEPGCATLPGRRHVGQAFGGNLDIMVL